MHMASAFLAALGPSRSKVAWRMKSVTRISWGPISRPRVGPRDRAPAAAPSRVSHLRVAPGLQERGYGVVGVSRLSAPT
jgi:hypothetical protein